MATTGAKAGDSNGDWQEVRRRRSFPNNWRQSQPTQPKANHYQPYAKPTYTQVLRRSPTPPNMAHGGQPSPASTQPNSPKATTVYYVSPHSPSRLRFPPSHTFPEWKGRCFRCCRTGHSAAKCRNPKRCGKCWSYGHVGSKCKQDIVPPPPPVRTAPKPLPLLQTEPGFDELLTGSYPYRTPEMPKERPVRLHCFIPRDEDYFAELDRLKQAVVLHTGSFQWELSVDNVCDYACRTNLVTKEEIQVSVLSGSRFLIMLPEGLDPDTFINATPQAAWDEGLSFQPWTPLENASISVPAFKILLNLVDVPPHLFRERHVAQAVCRFGVFLGSVAPENPSNLASWTVAVGVDDLSLVPPELVLHVGGMVHTVQVHTLSWERVPIYTADDMPKHPKVYRRPQPPPSSSSSSDTEVMHDDTEFIPMSTQVLKELCRGRTAATLPPELRQFATIEEMNLDHTHIATQDDATTDQPPQNQVDSINGKSLVLGSVERMEQNDRVTGKDIVIFNQAAQISATSCHIQSPRKSILETNQPDVHDSLIVTVQEKAKNQPINLGAPISNPKKILRRGDSSKNNSLGGIPNTEGVDSAIIKRSIFPRNENNSKNAPDRTKVSNQGVIISEKAAPKSKGFINEGHVSRAQEPGMIFQAKEKAQIDGPANGGPYARKYKWTRPIPNTAQVTKNIIAAASHKRKKISHPIVAPTKKISRKGKEKEQAEVSFNSEGFYEVTVQYDHISKLANGCGFNISDVEKAIKTDNFQRQTQAAQGINPNTTVSEEEVAALARFDLDPNDELTSEEEGA